MGLTGIGQWKTDAFAALDAFEEQLIEEMKNAARVVTHEMMSRTPVWSGKTVRNYAWGIGSASGGYTSPAGGDDGPRHPSGRGSLTLAGLGEEPNRAANEGACLDEMEGVLSGMTELETLVVTNHSPIWDLVDNGSAPTPERARNPGGVSVLAEQAAKGKLGNFR
jgi:hypothetical protein